MTDYMNQEQYRKACRYRMQETLENLMGAWQVPDEKVDGELITTSLQWLERMVGELHYFNEKIANASSGPPKPGFVPEK
ncbi:MAG: hypothetical protein GX033_01445 [Firmicutes bacterium]|nr:hypothetical protein [Bacillota bacterium]